MKQNYHPEPYWSDVARRIEKRSGQNIIAGDDEPFYRYKRANFLEMLNALDFHNRTVLEIGCGPGGNLKAIHSHKPRLLAGVDISEDMLQLAKQFLGDTKVDLYKTNGTQLPFQDQSFDVILTSTVLQHNTDDAMLRSLMNEICRCGKSEVILFERISRKISGDELCLGRPISYYSDIMKAQNYKIKKVKFQRIFASYLVCGAIRKLFNPAHRKEGEALSQFSKKFQNAVLPVTRRIDPWLKVDSQLAMLQFERK